jgi:hypothetical protein
MVSKAHTHAWGCRISVDSPMPPGIRAQRYPFSKILVMFLRLAGIVPSHAIT